MKEPKKKPLKSRRKRLTKAEKAAAWKRYRDARERATPPWADLEAIEKIYEECRAKNKKAKRKLYQVDHVIPLRGRNVSGFHLAENLRIITKAANRKKSNTYNPDD